MPYRGARLGPDGLARAVISMNTMDSDAGMDSDGAVAAARVLAAFLAVALLASEPAGSTAPFGLYALLLLAAGLQWRVSWPVVLRQPLRLSPLLAVLAAGLPLSRMLDRWLDGQPGVWVWTMPDVMLALSIWLRAFLAVTMLTLLVHSTGWEQIVRALRRLGLPEAVTLTLTQLERYRQCIAAEWRRTMQARESRSPGGHGFALASYSGQVGLVFLRSWERSERVHAAMMARGFRLESQVPQLPGASGWRLQWPSPLWLPGMALCVRLGSAYLGGGLADW